MELRPKSNQITIPGVSQTHAKGAEGSRRAEGVVEMTELWGRSLELSSYRVPALLDLDTS